MRRVLAAVALAACLPALALAAGPMETNLLVDGAGAPIGTGANPLQVGAIPFTRSAKAFALPVSTTPQTYAILQPAGSSAYRGINPCTVDVVITSVAATVPVTTQPVTMGGATIPNVLRVTSPTDSVNQFEDTLFLSRSGRTLSSTANPMGGQVRYVSIMALADPGTTPCAFRLHYGNNN
ncbi:hypothetical protein [Methylobacterium goesingense]|uniref:Uncharacterized protein n=1 Tax=Methylobacterium goesingense TaxID=243690 RepID=A0ABV2L1F7_9HYPH|nr:hypothetical protein [Methylobacterium goesingense]GJD72562.1 hypothetical protein CFIICLFH_0779 [Methylobacterium goesingense]